MRLSRPLLLVLAAAPGAAAAPVDYTRDVRPILSQHCFKCHGPDDNVRKAGLRLDRRPGDMGKTKSGEPTIVAGKPEASELARRIESDDETEVMPPPATKKPLSAAQKSTLRRWIAEEAQYKDHWSFVPPKQSELPKVKQADWPRNAIDYFVLARLENEGLKPSPPADKYTLVRRVYLDLIGLPPKPAEADAFVNDASPDAYEKLVDSLLRSPHYGERWARRWLDLARYADTNGYEKDRPRTMWLYRDWVIKALNDDLPFDQFTIQQLAGDLLPGATLEQKIATGFHRNTMLNEEGGADPLEFRWHAVNDRVATTGTVWLGLTLQCCQCHNHKFDPITQKEYYRIEAFLNNCDEPTIDVPSPEVAARRTQTDRQIAEREASLGKLFPPDPLAQSDDPRTADERRQAYLEARFRAWLDIERAKAIRWTVLRPVEAKANIPLLTVEGDGSVFVSGDKSKRDVYDLSFRTDLKNIAALRIEALPDDRLPNHGPGRVSYEGPFGDFFLCEATLTNDGKRARLGMVTADYFDGNNKPQNAADGDPLTGWSINGGQGRSHEIVFNLAQPIAKPGKLDLSLLFEKYYAAGLGKFRVSVTTDNKKAEARGIPNELMPLLRQEPSALSPVERMALRNVFLSLAPELKGPRDEIKKLRDGMPKFPTALVMAERPAHYTRPTFVHKRGEYTQPTEQVKPGVPAALPPLPTGAPADRLAFARWLVSGENPLTARVTVNRAWAAFFGRGIVRTTEDFGFQGEPPTHPELLDWLAVEFVRDGWSMKRLHKRIVMSATYQQASKVTPELVEKDPRNELLARGPRVRLEAELIRDCALGASGLLSPKIGGPSVFPPQPESVTAEGAYGALKWEVSPGEDRYRRGLYTFAKRTAPFAMTITFDGPSGEACVARREVSNTPLQALTLLNDQVFVEAAQTLGRQVAASSAATDAKARDLFRRCLTRPPSSDELKLVVGFYETQRKRFADKAADLAELSGGADVVQPLVERAAWTAAARAVLNLDEMVTKE
jgi:mono/diheme cytochrome c family protein